MPDPEIASSLERTHGFGEYELAGNRVFTGESSMVELRGKREDEDEMIDRLRNELWYEDFGFRAHLPEATIKFLKMNVPTGKDEWQRTLELACRNEKVVKLINVHGWGGNHGVFEVGDDQGASWTEEEITKALEENLPIVILNLDMNGRGRSAITQRGQEILEGGPRALFIARQKQLDTDDKFIDRMEELEGKDRKSGKSFFATMERGFADRYFREGMPGSIANGAEALHLLLDQTLGIRGVVGFAAHSKGAKELKYYLTQEARRLGRREYRESHNKSLFALGLAAAESDTDLKRELSIFQGLDVLQRRRGISVTQLASLVNLDRASVGVIVGHYGMNGLSGARFTRIKELHQQEFSAKKARELVAQAFTWAYPDYFFESPSLAPSRLMFSIRGQADRLTPNKRFREWLARAYFRKEMGYVDQLFVGPHLIEEMPGGHYFPFAPENQVKLTSTVVDTALTFQELSGEVADVLEQIKEYQPPAYSGAEVTRPGIRFSVVAEEEIQGDIRERFTEAVKTIKKVQGESLRPCPPVVVPVTWAESAVITNQLLSLSSFRRGEYVGRGLFAEFLEELGEDFGPEVERDWGDGFVTEGEENIPPLMNLANGFPFHLYIAGINDPDKIKGDIREWVYSALNHYEGPDPANEGHVYKPGTADKVCRLMLAYFQRGVEVYSQK